MPFGYSLLGSLVSCLQKADGPSLPVTFPSVNKDDRSITLALEWEHGDYLWWRKMVTLGELSTSTQGLKGIMASRIAAEVADGSSDLPKIWRLPFM
ncbi:hypothetical protein EUGRSUZ_H00011 [Eucalyptus grandis]|uniref:Uncharacterized protein n=2 Tax=Eucalyptus grandis TaxID=71139 RepID=A0ACC3JKT3_EUCGR|nr:hypothetical protein EUGRSUZ_H00011 [Eucalyptus grandis]